jgi:hypothetical protein
VPANFSPQITEKEIKIIPPYPDQGIRYEGYAKILEQNGYISKKQGTRYYVLNMQNKAAGAGITVSRVDSDTKNYFVTGIWIQYSTQAAAPNVIYLSDKKGTIHMIKFYFYILNTTYYENGIWIDLSMCPRKFEGTEIALINATAVGLNELVFVEVFGFEEEK